MKILVLFGKSNKGKTTTLNILINLLLKRGKNLLEIVTNYKHDNCLVIEIEDKKILITTRGDNEYSLKCDYEKFSEYEPDIFICAARSKGKTHDYISTLAPEENIFWLSKNTFSNVPKNNKELSEKVESYREKQNETQAEEMLNVLNDFFDVNLFTE